MSHTLNLSIYDQICRMELPLAGGMASMAGGRSQDRMQVAFMMTSTTFAPGPGVLPPTGVVAEAE
jgi:hypothetical protein